MKKLKDIQANQVLLVDYDNANDTDNYQLKNTKDDKLFEDRTDNLGIDYLHIENPYNDFRFEVLLPHIYLRQYIIGKIVVMEILTCFLFETKIKKKLIF